jgi:D-3-phosphoglycerate dehydrogenase
MHDLTMRSPGARYAQGGVYAAPGYVERNGYETAFSSIFGQINAFAAGTPINVINPDALAARKAGLS